ncbi:hypothetical protein BC830DRAFT_1136190 [Chytriomyces sp. MP71]|nr:hypothetical protein BC830DRAFT_1136190 [Chytriomyces sp. MP71]
MSSMSAEYALVALITGFTIAVSASPATTASLPALSVNQSLFLNSVAAAFNNVPECSLDCFIHAIPTQDPLSYITKACADPFTFNNTIVTCIQGLLDVSLVPGCIVTEDYDAVYNVLSGIPNDCISLAELFYQNETSLTCFNYSPGGQMSFTYTTTINASTTTLSGKVGSHEVMSPAFPILPHNGALGAVRVMELIVLVAVTLFGAISD